MLENKVQQQKSYSEALSAILSSVKYLSRQGLAIRGHNEEFGNLHQLLKLRSADVKPLAEFMHNPKSFTSHEVQNEILQMMSHAVLRQIIGDANKSPYFSVIADETNDEGHKKQLSVCLRYVVIWRRWKNLSVSTKRLTQQENVSVTFFETYYSDMDCQ